MSTRITKAQANKIAGAIMAVKFVPDLEKRRAELNADNVRRLLTYIPADVLEFSKRFPSYTRMERYHYIRNENGLRTTVHTLNDVIFRAGSQGIEAKVSNEDFDAFNRNSEELREMENKFRALRNDIVNKLVGRGVKSTCESWPEACPFIKAEMGEKEAQLPAIVNAELNAALGLPV